MDQKAEIATKITEMFREHLNINVPAHDTDLIGMGLLDSLALVDLILKIEEEMGIAVNMEELEIEDFRTVDTIATYLMTLKSAAA